MAFEINDLLTNEELYFKGYTKTGLENLAKDGLTGFEEYEKKISDLKKAASN